MGQKLARIAAELMGVRVASITIFAFSEPRLPLCNGQQAVVLIAMCNCIFRLIRMVTVDAT